MICKTTVYPFKTTLFEYEFNIHYKRSDKHDLGISNKSHATLAISNQSLVSVSSIPSVFVICFFCTTKHWELCTRAFCNTNYRNISTLSWRIRRYHQVMTQSLLSMAKYPIYILGNYLNSELHFHLAISILGCCPVLWHWTRLYILTSSSSICPIGRCFFSRYNRRQYTTHTAVTTIMETATPAPAVRAEWCQTFSLPSLDELEAFEFTFSGLQAGAITVKKHDVCWWPILLFAQQNSVP